MDDLQALAALQDPVRRALYDFVAARGSEVGRNEAAEATGVQRTLAAFHLDKLVEAGLLEAGFKRLGERTGPGSGRPAKVYRRAAGERTVSVPPRDYRALALVLAEVVDLVGGDEEAERAAHRVGRRLGGSSGEPLEAVLRSRGYEPYREDGTLRLRNCPFHVLAEEHPLLVCSMNLALCRGLLAGMEEREAQVVEAVPAEGAPRPAARTAPRADPRPGECCVVFTPGQEG